MRTLNSYVRPLIILLLFWQAALHYLLVTPAFEGPDEPEHFGFVTELRQNGYLPDANRSMQNLARQESGQAPLHYLLAALWSRFAPDYTWDGQLPKNPWHLFVIPLSASDNPNYFMFGPDQIPANPTIEAALRWQRFISPLEGILALALLFAAARHLMPTAWALWAMLLFGFNIVVIQLSALLNNDTSSILFGVACTYQLVLLARTPLTSRKLLISGIILALATLAKASLLVYAPVMIVVILARSMSDWRRLVRYTIRLALPLLAISGVWYGGNAVAYGDPLGIQPHLRMGWSFNPPRPLSDVLTDTVPLRTAWVGGTWGEIGPGSWVFVTPVLLLILAVIGYVRSVAIRHHFLIIMALALVCAGMVLALLRWLTLFTSVTGRLLLPGYAALALLITLGLAHGLSKRFERIVRLTTGTIIVFNALVIMPYVVLANAFTTVTFSPENVPSLTGRPLQFGDAKFLGYQLDPPILRPGESPTVTACWQSLRQDKRLPVPYAFAFHLTVGEDLYYGRDSYPGMGAYTNWQPGKAFCDRFTLVMHKPIEAGHAYRIAVQLYDVATLKPLPENTNSGPFVGWTAAPGPILTPAERQNAQYHFGELYLLDSQMRVKGSDLELNMAWGTGDWRGQEAVLFIHIMRGNQLVGQRDQPLGGDVYPVSLWGKDERTLSETYTLPLLNDLTTGDYDVFIGVYAAGTGERLPASAINGDVNSVRDNRVRLGAIKP